MSIVMFIVSSILQHDNGIRVWNKSEQRRLMRIIAEINHLRWQPVADRNEWPQTVYSNSFFLNSPVRYLISITELLEIIEKW